MPETFTLWGVGRYNGAVPVKLGTGSLKAANSEHAYRTALAARGFHGLVILKEGEPYPADLICVCGCNTYPGRGPLEQQLVATTGELARIRTVLAGWEQNQLEATSDAFAEGWAAGVRDAVTVHVSTDPGRIEVAVREVEQAGMVRNPYASAAETAEVQG